MTNNKEYTERRGSLIILTIIILLILLIVIIGLFIVYFAEKDQAKIALICLITILIILAISSFVFLELQRRQAQKKRDRGATEFVRQIYEQQRHQIESVQPIYNADNKTATWALTKPWRYSQRSTLPAT